METRRKRGGGEERGEVPWMLITATVLAAQRKPIKREVVLERTG